MTANGRLVVDPPGPMMSVFEACTHRRPAQKRGKTNCPADLKLIIYTRIRVRV